MVTMSVDSGGGVDSGDVLPDAAHAHASLHLDVTALAPPSAPAVLH